MLFTRFSQLLAKARTPGGLVNNSASCAASGGAAASSGEKRVLKKSGWDFYAHRRPIGLNGVSELRKSGTARMAAAFGTFVHVQMAGRDGAEFKVQVSKFKVQSFAGSERGERGSGVRSRGSRRETNDE